MSKDISGSPTLLMVTDTAMVKRDGRVYAFSPVVRELEVFQQFFNEIKWLGFERPDRIGDCSLEPVPEAVNCVLLPRSGGNRISDKLDVLMKSPKMTWCILRDVLRYDVIHTRAPSSPAFIATILSFFIRQKIWWHKYAGNWVADSPPFFYKVQRKLLHVSSWGNVTLNGSWPGQPLHCFSFENPCLHEHELNEGAKTIRDKNYDGQLELCFIGGLSAGKGIDKLLDSIDFLTHARVSCLHIVGDGPLRALCEEKARSAKLSIHVYGQLSREKVIAVMKRSHVIILPSKSEGFPKVIAEGVNYGCIPMVSDISAIGQYIFNGLNGFLLSPSRLEEGRLGEDITEFLLRSDLKEYAIAAHKLAKRFTYRHYSERIVEVILKDII